MIKIEFIEQEREALLYSKYYSHILHQDNQNEKADKIRY